MVLDIDKNKRYIIDISLTTPQAVTRLSVIAVTIVKPATDSLEVDPLISLVRQSLTRAFEESS
jgi:hypothetical protein